MTEPHDWPKYHPQTGLGRDVDRRRLYPEERLTNVPPREHLGSDDRHFHSQGLGIPLESDGKNYPGKKSTPRDN